jgi:hypothetical protein
VYAGKYSSIRELREAVVRYINLKNLDAALRLIHDFVERIITEPLCTAQIFGSKSLDELCLAIGKVSLEQVELANSTGRKNALIGPVYVYVVTKLQKSGGHTHVIEDFISARPTGHHIILTTELDGDSDPDCLVNLRVNPVQIAIEKAPTFNYQDRLAWLQKRLLELTPTKVYLFNHHQDSVAIAAMQPELNIDAAFYHHGDHHLCLGLYLTHLKHIDSHPMGYHNCRNSLGINNYYIPLTVADKGKKSLNSPFMPDGRLTTCTAARSNKIEVPYFISYVDILPKVLKVTGGRHIHIGRLSPWALFRIRRAIKQQGIRSDRFVYLAWVPSVWETLLNYQVDLYIASFPYGGGLTLIEAMGAGIPVALHKHLFSRLLSGIDLAYPEAFAWRQPEELLRFCSTLTTNHLEAAGQLGRLQFEKFHSDQQLRTLLDEIDCDNIKPHSITDQFIVETDEWALVVERQLNFSRLFARGAYRLVKRIRSWV